MVERSIELKTNKGFVRYLLLYPDHDANKDSRIVLDNIKMSLFYAKLPYDVMTFKQWRNANPSLDIYAKGAVIVVGENQSDLSHIDKLKSYVNKKGGLLVNAILSVRSPLNRLMGITTTTKMTIARGVQWLKPIYPGLSECDLPEKMFFSSAIDLKLDSHVTVIAKSRNHIPLVWMMNQGKGRVLYWNLNMNGFGTLFSRGIFLQTMLKAQGRGVRMTVGALLVYIDDYPSPVWNQYSEPILMTDYEFRQKNGIQACNY